MQLSRLLLRLRRPKALPASQPQDPKSELSNVLGIFDYLCRSGVDIEDVLPALGAHPRYVAIRKIYEQFDPVGFDPGNYHKNGLDVLIPKLKDVLKELANLQRDASYNDFDKKLFFIYDELRQRAEDLRALKAGKSVTATWRQRGDFTDLGLGIYTDSVRILDELYGLVSVVPTICLGRLNDMRDLACDMSQNPNTREQEHWTPERVALLQFIDAWLEALTGPLPQPQAIVPRTTRLPLGYECKLRFWLTSTGAATYRVTKIELARLSDAAIVKPPESINCNSVNPVGLIQGEVSCSVCCKTPEGPYKLKADFALGEQSHPLDCVAPITFYKPQSADSDFFKTKRNELENAPPLPSRKKQCEEIFSEIKSRVPPSHKTGVLGIGIRGELKCGKRDPESRIGIRFLSDACLKCDAGKNAGISLSSGGAHKWTLTILAHPAGSISVEYCNLTPSNASFTSSRSSYGSGDKILFCELPSAKDEHREKDLAYVTDVPSLEQTDIRWLLEEIGVVGGNSAYLRAKVPSTGDDEIANRFKSSFLHFDEEAESTIYELAKDHPDFAVDICEEVVDYCGKNQLLYVSGENANSALEVSEKWREVARNKIRGPSGKKAQQLSKDADVKRFQDAREAMAREIAKLFEMSSRPVPLRQIEVKTLDLDQDPYDVICDLVEDKIILEKGTGYIFSNRLYLTVAKPPDQS